MAKDDKKTSKSSTIDNPSGAASNLPPFYTKPVPLHPERHSEYSLKEDYHFEVANQTSSIILNAVEFAATARDYPIVFAGNEEQVIPVAVMGLKEGTNLFIDDKGTWLEGHYIPAYVRRYPFIFMEGQEKDQLILCIDEKSNLLVKSDVRPLFDQKGEKTALTERALQFCAQYQKEFERTKAFTKELVKRDLLTVHRADIQIKTGEKFSVGGFRVIDENKFNQLPDDVILEWRKLGYLGLVYCHLISAGNWQNLVNIAAMDDDAAKAPAKKKTKAEEKKVN